MVIMRSSGTNEAYSLFRAVIADVEVVAEKMWPIITLDGASVDIIREPGNGTARTGLVRTENVALAEDIACN
jgi:hypothetical protein